MKIVRCRLTIDPTADTTIENDETVFLTLASGTGYTIGTSGVVTGTIANNDSTSTSFSSSSGYGLVNASEAVAKALNSNPFPKVPVYGDKNDWNINMVNAPEVWVQGYTGSEIVVAVLDTGVDRNHVDLWSNIFKYLD